MTDLNLHFPVGKEEKTEERTPRFELEVNVEYPFQNEHSFECSAPSE